MRIFVAVAAQIVTVLPSPALKGLSASDVKILGQHIGYAINNSHVFFSILGNKKYRGRDKERQALYLK
jgi:hypothetical protein